MNRMSVVENLKSEATEPTSSVYLFCSNDKISLKAFALHFANMILCESHSVCNVCGDCIRISKNKHPDMIVVDDDSINVEMAHNIIEQTIMKPMFGKYKVFLIHNADNMSELAQNKLLKTLEEPPESCILILDTTAIIKLLPTIISRARRIDIEGMADAESVSEEYANMREKCGRLVGGLSNTKNIPALVDMLGLKNTDREIFFKVLLGMYKEKIFAPDDLDEYSLGELLQICEIIDKAYLSACRNVMINYCVDNMLIEIVKVRYLCRQK